MRFLLGWLLLWAVSGFGAILEWDPNPETNVVGYRVYWGPASRTYSNVLQVTNVTATISNSMMTPGTNYFAVTAFDDQGLESDFSDEVYTPRRPIPPTRLKISDRLIIQQSTNLVDWTSIATNLISTGESAAFFRSVQEGTAMPAPTKRLRITAGSKVGKL